MVRTERFRNMDEVAQELRRLNTIREAHADRLERHWEALQDHDVRGRLFKDALHDVIRSWKPAHIVSALFGGGSLGGSLAAAVGGGGGWFRRALRFGISMAVPSLLSKLNDLSVNDIAREVQVSYQRFREHLQARKAANAHQPTDDDDDE